MGPVAMAGCESEHQSSIDHWSIARGEKRRPHIVECPEFINHADRASCAPTFTIILNSQKGMLIVWRESARLRRPPGPQHISICRRGFSFFGDIHATRGYVE